MTWHWILFPLGIMVGLIGRKLWLWLDKTLDRWLDGVTIVFVPEEKTQEVEQHLWGQG